MFILGALCAVLRCTFISRCVLRGAVLKKGLLLEPKKQERLFAKRNIKTNDSVCVGLRFSSTLFAKTLSMDEMSLLEFCDPIGRKTKKCHFW